MKRILIIPAGWARAGTARPARDVAIASAGRRGIAALAALMLGLGAPAMAQEQVGFQQFTLGQSLDRARALPLTPDTTFGPVKLRCDGEFPDGLRSNEEKAELAAGMAHCHPSVVIGGDNIFESVPVGGGTSASVSLEFLAGTLVRITTHIDMTAEQQIGDALRLKFGKPTNEVTSDFQTRAGAHFQRLTTTWRKGDATISFVHPDVDLRVMTVRYSLPDADTFDAMMRAQTAGRTQL